MRAVHPLPAFAPTPLALGLNKNVELLAARGINRTDGIPREHLRSLVKDDDIELKIEGFKVHADRKRTHHPARLESDEQIRHTSEKLSQRQVSFLLADLVGTALCDS